MQRVSACGKASKYFISLSDERLSNFDLELTLVRLQADLLCLVRDVPVGSSGRTVVEEMQGPMHKRSPKAVPTAAAWCLVAQEVCRHAASQMVHHQQCTDCSSRPASQVSCRGAACCLPDGHTCLSWHLSHLVSACLQAASVRLHTKCCWRPGTTVPKTPSTRAATVAAGRAGEACWQSCCRCPGACDMVHGTSKSFCLHRTMCQCSMRMLTGQGWPPGRAAAG